MTYILIKKKLNRKLLPDPDLSNQKNGSDFKFFFLESRIRIRNPAYSSSSGLTQLEFIFTLMIDKLLLHGRIYGGVRGPSGTIQNIRDPKLFFRSTLSTSGPAVPLTGIMRIFGTPIVNLSSTPGAMQGLPL